ncbi:MAG TPA: SDR family NAD(P)-dependent oxidoreductase [Gaiellaceae bacterium]|nr:SDR family NAD(P)-dependent oxidoreductase [Gaiellaceae bacterium]
MSGGSPQERVFDVRGLRVVVTGAASGLGLAMAEILAECGARVTLADVDAERLENVTAALAKRGGTVRSFVVDVSDEAQVQALVDDVVTVEGGLDVVFANAGIASVPGFAVEGGQRLETVERSDWDKVLGVNLNGVLFTMKHAAAVMKRQGAGRIVVTSSNAGLRPEPVVCYGYTASKAAILNVVRLAALELAPHGVLVNAICPGPFKGTRIGGGVTENPDEATERMWATTVPLGRMAEPEELKGLVLLLASPASSFMTGAAYLIDGGTLVLAGPA